MCRRVRCNCWRQKPPTDNMETAGGNIEDRCELICVGGYKFMQCVGYAKYLYLIATTIL